MLQRDRDRVLIGSRESSIFSVVLPTKTALLQLVLKPVSSQPVHPNQQAHQLHVVADNTCLIISRLTVFQPFLNSVLPHLQLHGADHTKGSGELLKPTLDLSLEVYRWIGCCLRKRSAL